MKTVKLVSTILALGLACSCGGQQRKGIPNDPNEQQGNRKAQPQNSVTNKSNAEPSDNKAGRNAHSDLPNGANNQ